MVVTPVVVTLTALFAPVALTSPVMLLLWALMVALAFSPLAVKLPPMVVTPVVVTLTVLFAPSALTLPFRLAVAAFTTTLLSAASIASVPFSVRLPASFTVSVPPVVAMASPLVEVIVISCLFSSSVVSLAVVTELPVVVIVVASLVNL